MKKKYVGIISAFTGLSLLLSGCGDKSAGAGDVKKQADQAAPVVSTEPVTLKIAIPLSWLGKGEYEKYIVEPVKKKYPHITLELLDVSAYDKIVAAGQIPDVAYTASPLINRLTQFDLQDNMEPLIKKFNFDLSKLNKVALDSVKTASGYDYLIGIPFTMHFNALYYNKDIFDRFGAPYPKDGMTWDDARELARKVTRLEGGIQYRGLEPDYSYRVASVLGLGIDDPKTGKATVNNDGWKKVFELLKSVYDIPGNAGLKLGTPAQDLYFKTRTLAMLPGLNFLPSFNGAEGLNWDMVQYPQFKEAPNTGMQVDEWILHVTKQSKHKDQAFQVITTVLSEEVQTDMARNGRFPILTGKKVEEEFGKDIPYLKGKNLKAAFLSQPSKALPITKYGESTRKIMEDAIKPVIKGEKDINTVLRESEEAINKLIEKDKSK